MDAKERAQEFIRYVLGKICEDPESIKVEATDDDRGTLITVSVDDEDTGRVIGKDGQTISALRTLVQSIGMREGVRLYVKVLTSD